MYNNLRVINNFLHSSYVFLTHWLCLHITYSSPTNFLHVYYALIKKPYMFLMHCLWISYSYLVCHLYITHTSLIHCLCARINYRFLTHRLRIIWACLIHCLLISYTFLIPLLCVCYEPLMCCFVTVITALVILSGVQFHA